MPAFYKGNMFALCEDGSYQVRLKIFFRNDWIWQTFTLNKSDMDSIAVKRGFSFDKASSPVLKKRGRRFSTVCAYSTSLLAYDGSGKVARDKDNHSLCTFKTGKRYNADLNASYNIGARYFIREILKTLSGRKVSEVQAKVPELSVRTRCTLATLYSLTAVLVA